MAHLYHLVPEAVWGTCKSTKTPYFPPTYAQDGFIHLTKEPELLLPVANHFYKAEPGKYTVLKLDATKLVAEVKFEPAAPVGEKETTNFKAKESTEQLFPHLYGTIDFDSVVAELDVERAEDGTFHAIQGV